LRTHDKRLHKTLCQILKELIRTEDLTSGTGKPEALEHNHGELWSRRLSHQDQLVYRFDDLGSVTV